MKLAWVENGRVKDVCPVADPFNCYHPDVAKFYNTEVPDDAEHWDQWVDGNLIKPPPRVVSVALEIPETPAPT
jgi:hypothetical protein